MSSTDIVISDRGQQLRNNLMTNLREEMVAALPASISPERLATSIVLAGERNPALYQCQPQTMMLASMTMAVLNLECDGVTGQGYMLPFAGKIQPVIGYKGYNTLAARNGWSIDGNVVREGDKFDYGMGTSPHLEHRPRDRNKKPITHAWAVATRPGFAPIIVVLDSDEIGSIKKKSPGAKKRDSPWNDTEIGFPVMAAKSAKRRLARALPLGWVPVGATMSDQWDMNRPAYVERDEDGGGVVVLHTEYTGVREEAPPKGVMEGEVVEDWPVHVPGKPSRMHANAGEWARDFKRLLERGKDSPNLEAFWTLNADGLERLGVAKPELAEGLIALYGSFS